jgi:hypothetical protein
MLEIGWNYLGFEVLSAVVIMSYGVLKVTDISGEHAASIFRVKN